MNGRDLENMSWMCQNTSSNRKIDLLKLYNPSSVMLDQILRLIYIKNAKNGGIQENLYSLLLTE